MPGSHSGKSQRDKCELPHLLPSSLTPFRPLLRLYYLVLVSTCEPSPTTPKISFLLPTAPSLGKPTVEAWRHYPPGTTQSSPTHLILPLQQSWASTYSHCMEKELQRRHKLSQFLCQDRGWPRPLLCLAPGLITPLCVPYSMMSHVFSQWALATKIQTHHLQLGS